MKRSVIFLTLMGFLAGLPSSLMAQTADGAEPDWFDQDPEAMFRSINEGQLDFLETPPEKPVHHHHNTLIVLPSSLSTGWIKLVQCHEHLDEFPSAQIVYSKERVRELRITTTRNIGNAWVEDSSVQLTHVGKNARLCVEAESRALIAQDDGSYLMRNGPFMRKFLDGYFPMRVSIDVKMPENLRFVSVEPIEQKGFRVKHSQHGVHLDAWFEGKLVTRLRFKLVKQAKIQ